MTTVAVVLDEWTTDCGARSSNREALAALDKEGK